MIELVANIIRFAPIVTLLLGIAGSGFGSGLVVWQARSWVYEHFDTPRIQHAQREADVDEFEALAARAKRDQELAFFKIFDRFSTEAFLAAIEEEAWHKAQIDLLQSEIEQYVEDGGDRSACALSQRDLDFLGGVHAGSGPASR